jgi:hypothetical protein
MSGARDRRFLEALIESLDRAHSLGRACRCPEHRIVAAYRAGERQPPQLPSLGLVEGTP